MKEKPQEQEQQVHIDPASAQQEPEYSLEDIMNEFGGWSKRETPAEPEAEPQTPAEPPRVWPPEQQAGPEPSAQPGLSGDTIRFTPVAQPEPEDPPVKIWSYKGEAEPIAPEPDDSAQRKRAARTRRKAAAQQRRLERYQKREQKKLRRRQEQPDVIYASAEEAYAAYCKRSSIRLRLILSLLACLGTAAMLVFASVRVGGVDLTAHARALSAGMLAAMLAGMCLAYDVLLAGLRQWMRLRPESEGLLLLAALVTAADACFAIAAGRVPFCAAVSLELTVALWGRQLLMNAKRKTMKAVCSMPSPVAAVREEKAWHGRDCIFRAPGERDSFAEKLEIPDATRRVMRVYTPLLAGLTLAASLLTTFQSGQTFLWAWSAMLLAGFPTGVLIAYARPFAALSKRLIRAGCALAGWYGARTMSGECGVAVEDTDLFPTQNVTLNGMKIYSDRSASQIIGYGAAVVASAGSGLAPLFEEMMQSQNGRHYSVDTFRRYEGGGLGAEIRGDVILMGSLAFMKLMKVRMPEGARLKQAVYLSINSELAAVFALTYAPAAAARNSLLAATRTKGLLPILATRDFMITPQFVKQRYKISPDRIEFPTVEERARLSSPEAAKSGKQGALMVRGGFSSFIAAVVGARSLHASAVGSMVISLAGGAFGALMLFFLAFIGSVQAASALNVFLLAVLWLLPNLLITALTGRT